MKTGIFYGTSTSNTADVAELLHKALGGLADKPADIEGMAPGDILGYSTLLLGIPTWNVGEMQKDWEVLAPRLGEHNLAGKKIALFGCGDQVGYPDTFGDALGLLWDILEPQGAKLIGRWPTEGYEFEGSLALRDGKFLGLLIDVENQSELTQDRVTRWASLLKKELGV